MTILAEHDLIAETPLSNEAKLLRSILHDELRAYLATQRGDDHKALAHATADLGMIFAELQIVMADDLMRKVGAYPSRAARKSMYEFTQGKASETLTLLSLIALLK